MRRQLEQRDEWLAELRLELHELRAEPAPPLETQAEIETLRSKIAGIERALAEAHNLRSAAQADLMHAHEQQAHAHRASATAREALREAGASATRRDAAASSDRATLASASIASSSCRPRSSTYATTCANDDEQQRGEASRHRRAGRAC